MLLFHGALEIKWHGTVKSRVRRIADEDGMVAAIRYYRSTRPEGKRHLKSEHEYVKRVTGSRFD